MIEEIPWSHHPRRWRTRLSTTGLSNWGRWRLGLTVKHLQQMAECHRHAERGEEDAYKAPLSH
jgi:hypothetical protein